MVGHNSLDNEGFITVIGAKEVNISDIPIAVLSITYRIYF
jgi:hypothetical protein